MVAQPVCGPAEVSILAHCSMDTALPANQVQADLCCSLRQPTEIGKVQAIYLAHRMNTSLADDLMVRIPGLE